MKNTFKYLAAILIATSIIACSKVPITGRKQLKLIPNSMMMEMGQSSYASFLKENPAVNPPTMASATVANVGYNVSKAVEKYLNDNNLNRLIEGYKWEFNVVDSKDVNAWCMPGGKVVVYTGLLPLTKDDAGLAVVLGHEIAHAIANHGNERMSQQLAVQLGGISLQVAMAQKPQQTQELFLTAFGVGSSLGMLAYSRKHELEADKLGLIFMAMAGYDPERALSFWQEMASVGGNKPPEIISTHPSDQRRIEQVKAFLPEAKKYYTTPNGSQGSAVKSNTSGQVIEPSKPLIAPDPKKLGIKIK